MKEVKTLQAKWLDPECYGGCQSLVLKHKIERLEKCCEEFKKVCEQVTSPLRPHWRDTLRMASNALVTYEIYKKENKP